MQETWAIVLVLVLSEAVLVIESGAWLWTPIERATAGGDYSSATSTSTSTSTDPQLIASPRST